MANLGIDFGSSYTTVAWQNPLNGKPEAVKFNGDGSVKLPSAILVTNFGLIIGFQALNYLEDVYKLPNDVKIEILSNFIPSIKRILNPDITETLGEKQYTHEELLTAFFRYLLEQVNAHCGHNIHFDSVTFSYPVDFTESKKRIIRNAFINNGLKIKDEKYEPLAAVKGYSLGHSIDDNNSILVFDFGGGTIDVACIKKIFSELKVVCEPKGSSSCGGQDLDFLIYNDLRKKIQTQYSFDISVDGLVDYGILNVCRRLKEYFSGKNDYYETQLALVVNGQFINYKYGLSRETFNNIIYPKIQEAVGVAKQVIADAKRLNLTIKTVLLIGGSSQLTLVKDLLCELLPESIIETCGEKDIAVALGNLECQAETTTIVNKPENPENKEQLELDKNRSMRCQRCQSEECYKMIGKSGYHCTKCGWEGRNIIIHF